MANDNLNIKQKIFILLIDKLIIVIIVALVGLYIDSRMKRLDSELITQREFFLNNVKLENEKTLKKLEQTFQAQQIEKKQDFDLQLEKVKSNLSFTNEIDKTTVVNKNVSFSRLMALKNPWAQYLVTNLEAKLLSEFYERKYQLFSHDNFDLEEAKRQNDRGIALIRDISKNQQEVFEVLGLIQVYFKPDKELQNAIDDLYNYKSLDIKSFPNNFRTQGELDAFFQKVGQEMRLLVTKEYTNKMERIIVLLKKRLQ